jgi:AP-2 complex subunit alpha
LRSSEYHFKDFDRDCVSDSINKSNADHAVLFESVNLIVCWGSSGPAQLRDGAMVAGKFISVREPNIRYLGLLTMAKLAQLEGSAETIKKHQALSSFP